MIFCFRHSSSPSTCSIYVIPSIYMPDVTSPPFTSCRCSLQPFCPSPPRDGWTAHTRTWRAWPPGCGGRNSARSRTLRAPRPVPGSLRGRCPASDTPCAPRAERLGACTPVSGTDELSVCQEFHETREREREKYRNDTDTYPDVHGEGCGLAGDAPDVQIVHLLHARNGLQLAHHDLPVHL